MKIWNERKKRNLVFSTRCVLIYSNKRNQNVQSYNRYFFALIFRFVYKKPKSQSHITPVVFLSFYIKYRIFCPAYLSAGYFVCRIFCCGFFDADILPSEKNSCYRIIHGFRVPLQNKKKMYFYNSFFYFFEKQCCNRIILRKLKSKGFEKLDPSSLITNVLHNSVLPKS